MSRPKMNWVMKAAEALDDPQRATPAEFCPGYLVLYRGFPQTFYPPKRLN